MNDQRKICPDCETGHLVESVYADEFKHGDGVVRVDGLEGYLCDNCSVEPIYPAQMRRNHARVADAKRQADGLLTGAGVRAIREHMGMTQAEASVVFGGGANAFSKYERGDVSQSVAMDRLLKSAAFVPGVLEFLQWESGAMMGGGSCADVSRYQVSATLSMKTKGFTSRSVQGQRIEVARKSWNAEAA